MRRPSPALIISIIALVFATAGTGYATVRLAANSVGTAQLQNGAVKTEKIKSAAVTAPKIANGAVGTAKIAGDAVTSAKIADGTIVTADIAAATRTALRGAVTTGASGIFVPRAGTTKVIAAGDPTVLVSLGRDFRTDIDEPSPGGPNFIRTADPARLLVVGTANLMRVASGGASSPAKVYCRLWWSVAQSNSWLAIPGGARQTFATGSYDTYESVTVVGWVDVAGTVNGRESVTDIRMTCVPEDVAGLPDAEVRLQYAALDVVGVPGAGTGGVGAGTG